MYLVSDVDVSKCVKPEYVFRCIAVKVLLSSDEQDYISFAKLLLY